MLNACIPKNKNLSFLALLTLSMACSLMSAEEKAPSPSMMAGTAVVFDGKPLFFVHDRILSFSAEERSKAISDKIAKIGRDSQVSLADIKVLPGDGTMDITAGEQVLMSVTTKDAKSAQLSIEQLSLQNAELIRQAIQEYRHTHGLKNFLWSMTYTSIATLILFSLLYLIKRGFPKLYNRITVLKDHPNIHIKIQQIELLRAEQITSVLLGLTRLLRLILTLGLLYFYIPIVFSFFPQTESWAKKLLKYIYEPLQSIGTAILDYVPNLFLIAITSILIHFVLKFVKLIFSEIRRERITFTGFYPEWADTTYKMVRFLILALTVVMLFPYIPGSHSPAFKGISVFLGVLFSFGSTSIVTNMMAGILLTYMRPFKIGDRIKVGETVGDVVEKNLLATRIRTIKNIDVTVPNAGVLSGSIQNFTKMSSEAGIVLHTQVSIGYDAPWREIHRLLVEAAKETPFVLPAPAPFVHQTALNDFYVTYEINAYTDSPHKMADIYSRLHQNIQDKFNQAKIQIMSPHFMNQPEKAVLAEASQQ